MKIMAKKKPAGSRHKHKAIGLRLDDSKRQEVEALAASERRSLAMMCQILVEEALAARKGKQ
jgi:hypothetical protein